MKNCAVLCTSMLIATTINTHIIAMGEKPADKLAWSSLERVLKNRSVEEAISTLEYRQDILRDDLQQLKRIRAQDEAEQQRMKDSASITRTEDYVNKSIAQAYATAIKYSPLAAPAALAFLYSNLGKTITQECATQWIPLTASMGLCYACHALSAHTPLRNNTRYQKVATLGTTALSLGLLGIASKKMHGGTFDAHKDLYLCAGGTAALFCAWNFRTTYKHSTPSTTQK